MKNRLLILMALLISAVSIAQNGINYKALIKDANGDVLATQSVTVQFQILEGGTTNVYQETHTPTTDANGIVVVNIGEGTVDNGNFLTIDWSAVDHFLNVQVDTGAGLVDLGTTQFKSVPYAKMADKAMSLVTNETKVGDIKTGLQPGDHDGWVKLDGRLINTLTTSQQNNANIFGFSTNLPNADNSVLMQNNNTLGAVTGDNLITVNQNNLPNITLNGTTNTGGDHNHDFYTATNDANSSASQGYPQGNLHRAFRTTDRRQLIRNNGNIQQAGSHTHTVNIPIGGNEVPLDITPMSLSVNTFVFLGIQ